MFVRYASIEMTFVLFQVPIETWQLYKHGKTLRYCLLTADMIPEASLIIYSADLISPSVQMQMWSDRKESGSLWIDWCDFTIRKLERLYLTWPGLASSQIDASYGVASSGGLSLTSSIRMLTAVWEAMDVLSVRRRGDIKHTESFIQDFNMYILLCD